MGEPRSLRRNIFANLTGRTWINILNLLFIPIYLHFIGIEAWALVGFYITILNTAALADLGLSATLNRELARLTIADDGGIKQRDLLRTLESIYWLVSIVIGLAVWFLADGIAGRWLNGQNLPVATVANALRLMAPLIALQLPFNFYQNGLAGLERQVLSNAIFAGGGTLRMVVTAVVLWQVSPTIEAFFLSQLPVSLLQTFVMARANWSSLPKTGRRPAFDVTIISRVWRFSTSISANSVLGVMLTQLDKVFLSKLLTLEEFGYYTLAWTVASALWTVTMPINTALFPRFTKMVEAVGKTKDESALAELYHRSSQFMAVLLLPGAITLMVFTREIMYLWSGNQAVADNTVVVLSLLVFGTALSGIASVPAYLQAAANWPQLMMFTNLGAAIALLPCLWYLANRFGAAGAAALWLAINALYFLITIPLMHRRLLSREKIRWYLQDFLLPFSICALLIYGARYLLPGNPTRVQMAEVALGAWAVATLACTLQAGYVREELFRFAARLKARR